MGVDTNTLSREDLEALTQQYREKAVMQGIVKTVSVMNIPVEQENGSVVTKETDVAIFRLADGVTGYCPKEEFREHNFKNLNGFVGTIQDVVITRIDLESQLAFVSVKQADAKKRTEFWKEIKQYEEQGELQEHKYPATIQGINTKNQIVHCRVNGQDCFMYNREWDWNRTVNVEEQADRGMEIDVVVVRFDESVGENGIVEVSRRLTKNDPFEKLDNLYQNDLIMGKVSRVDKIHGIFVVVEGVELKGTKPRALPEPLVGEVVSCRVMNIQAKERKGKVVIVDYPRGKKKRKDLGEFLYE